MCNLEKREFLKSYPPDSHTEIHGNYNECKNRWVWAAQQEPAVVFTLRVFWLIKTKSQLNTNTFHFPWTLSKCNLRCTGLRRKLKLCTPPEHLPRGVGRTAGHRHHTTSRAWGAVPGRGPTAALGASIPAHVEAKPSQARSLPGLPGPRSHSSPSPFYPHPGDTAQGRWGRCGDGPGPEARPAPGAYAMLRHALKEHGLQHRGPAVPKLKSSSLSNRQGWHSP